MAPPTRSTARTRRGAALAAAALWLSAPAAAQTLHKAPDRGFTITYPDGWRCVPIKASEDWILAKFLSDRDYGAKDVVSSGVLSHRPMMRVLEFAKGRKRVELRPEATTDSRVSGASIEHPYLDYSDWFKRNFVRQGGWYVSKEQAASVGTLPVTLREVSVEKDAAAPRRFLACIYDLPDRVLVADVDVLETRYESMQGELWARLKSLKLTDMKPAGDAPASRPSAVRVWIFSDDKTFAAELEKRTKAWRERVIRQATAGLPKGWSKRETKKFVAVYDSGENYVDLLLRQAHEVRAWLDDKFKDLGRGEVLRTVIRVCKTSDEAAAYHAGSGDSYVVESGEVVCTERGGSILNDFSKISEALTDQYFAEKNPALRYALPPWAVSGLVSLLGDCQISNKTTGLIFHMPISDVRTTIRATREKRLVPIEAVISKPLPAYAGRSGGGRGGFGAPEEPLDEAEIAYAESRLFVRYLLIGPGRSDSKCKGLFQTYCARVLQDLETRDRESWVKEFSKRDVEKEPTTEAEEEEMLKRRRDNAKTAGKAFIAAEADTLDRIFQQACGGWTKEDWKRINSSFGEWARGGAR